MHNNKPLHSLITVISNDKMFYTTATYCSTKEEIWVRAMDRYSSTLSCEQKQKKNQHSRLFSTFISFISVIHQWADLDI